MSSKNNLQTHPWHPGCSLTPAQWHYMENNRIASYLHKQCCSIFPSSGDQHAPPPTAFANIFNPPVDPIQQLPSSLINPAPYGLSQPAPLSQYSLPAPSNPYQHPPLANLTNATIQSQPSVGSPPCKKSPIFAQAQPSTQPYSQPH